MNLATALFQLVAAVAAFKQGASGFAFVLIASALWAWLIEPQVLTPTLVLTSLTGKLSSLVRVGGQARFAHAGPCQSLSVPGWATCPLVASAAKASSA